MKRSILINVERFDIFQNILATSPNALLQNIPLNEISFLKFSFMHASIIHSLHNLLKYS